MPKSRHRKNHKQKVKQYKKGLSDARNREMRKYYEEMKQKQEEMMKMREEQGDAQKPITL
jgi:phosphopantetheine adenylyltransferase